MKDIEQLLRMTERPQNYTDEELQQLMNDPDMRAYYELMVKAEDAFVQRKSKRTKSVRLWKVAAMFVGIILLSGITFAAVHFSRSTPDDVKTRAQEIQTSDLHQQTMEIIPQDSIRTFENTELQQILSELADHYHLDVAFHNEQTRHLRLYTKWDTSAPLSQMIERLNNFEKVSIRQTDNQIIAE